MDSKCPYTYTCGKEVKGKTKGRHFSKTQQGGNPENHLKTSTFLHNTHHKTISLDKSNTFTQLDRLSTSKA